MNNRKNLDVEQTKQIHMGLIHKLTMIDIAKSVHETSRRVAQYTSRNDNSGCINRPKLYDMIVLKLSGGTARYAYMGLCWNKIEDNSAIHRMHDFFSSKM